MDKLQKSNYFHHFFSFPDQLPLKRKWRHDFSFWESAWTTNLSHSCLDDLIGKTVTTRVLWNSFVWRCWKKSIHHIKAASYLSKGFQSVRLISSPKPKYNNEYCNSSFYFKKWNVLNNPKKCRKWHGLHSHSYRSLLTDGDIICFRPVLLH